MSCQRLRWLSSCEPGESHPRQCRQITVAVGDAEFLVNPRGGSPARDVLGVALMSRRISAGVAASLVLCMLLACSSSGGDDEHDRNNFRKDVIECEDALAQLERCCPGFDAKPVLCNYSYDHSAGCGSSSTMSITPALSTQESSCIREKSCEALIGGKVCERAQQARLYISNTSYTTSSSSSSSSSCSTSGYDPSPTYKENSTHKAVCP